MRVRLIGGPGDGRVVEVKHGDTVRIQGADRVATYHIKKMLGENEVFYLGIELGSIKALSMDEALNKLIYGD